MNLNDIYKKVELKRKEKLINDYIEFEVIKEKYDQYLKHLENESKNYSSGRILIRKHGIGSMIISKTFIVG